MCEGSPAFLHIGLLIPYTHEMDSNLHSCHVDALHELHISQALNPLCSSNTINSFPRKQHSSERSQRQNGSTASPPCARKIHRGLVSIWFPQLKLNEHPPDTGIPTRNPQIPLKWSRTMPNRVKGK